MCTERCLRFISGADVVRETMPWGPHEWFSRPGLTAATNLQLVRVTMPPGRAHAFHRHPCFEELLYCLEGECEQWVGREKRLLRPGEVVHVPRDEVHGTYNVSSTPVKFLAILSEAKFDGPAVIDMSGEPPWKSLRA
ncbi:MAG: cupin domain-containing protein [Planctomycetes bacterium]|nr:cupin domain-containing protein [Planctomycetota bacterium]